MIEGVVIVTNVTGRYFIRNIQFPIETEYMVILISADNGTGKFFICISQTDVAHITGIRQGESVGT